MKIKVSCSVILLILNLVAYCQSLKLLLLFPIPAKSHYFLGSELGKGLAKLGHDVTILSMFEEKNPPKNYKEIVLSEAYDKAQIIRKEKNINQFDMENASPFLQLAFLTTVAGDLITDLVLNETKVQDLINTDEKFDAVILEQFLNDAMKYVAYKFDAPLILFSTIGPNRWVNNLVANPENPSYIVDLLLSFETPMTFFEKLYNLAFGIVSDLILYNYFYPRQSSLLKKYFPNAPDLNEFQYNISLVLTNSHESIYEAVPHVPNMIDIGGFHVNPPKELEKEFKDFMDNAKEGVIYFSLGSNLVPSMMPKATKDIILKVLGSRKERVLWKWNEDKLENRPSNVMISKWFPQQAILAHPNCKLFISHGGLLSLTETVYLGVPVLAFPIFGDQKLNAARIRMKKIGVTLPFSRITEESLSAALDEVLDNPIYRQNMKTSQTLFHDRPMKPIELADYWIKYVVRHRGAPHLRVAAINLPLYKYYMLDILAIVVGSFLLLIYIFYKLNKLVFHKIVASRSAKQKRE